MKKISIIIISKFKYLLFIPLLLMVFCSKDTDVEIYDNSAYLDKDSKVIKLMIEAVTGKSSIETDIKKSGTTDNDDEYDQCTQFKYPLTFYLNLEESEAIVINSDEELIMFLNSLSDDQLLKLYFPIVLYDSQGEETIIYNEQELEGTLDMANNACDSFNDDDSADDGDNPNDTNDHITSDDDAIDFTPYICDNNGKKVNICHNGKTICVSVNAIWGHLNQHKSDFLGNCD